jgi:thiosulfate/3-mercaptopyruvate sulfurtransferase
MGNGHKFSYLLRYFPKLEDGCDRRHIIKLLLFMLVAYNTILSGTCVPSRSEQRMREIVPFPEGRGRVKWVTTDWLADQLENKELMILDCQPNIHDYVQEHLPGARYLNEGVFRIMERSLPSVFIPPRCAESILKKAGLDADVPVVVYSGKGPFKGWGDGLEQTMVAYSLARFGHNNVYVLDGGIDAWKAEGRPLSQEFPKVRQSDFAAKVRTKYFIDMKELKELVERPGVMLLDARPAPFYEGKGPWIKPGHIPGAVSLPWANLMLPDNKYALKPDEQINALLKEKGIAPEKTIICSCGTGREATNEFLLFRWFLRYPKVYIYEGSFNEWSSYPDNPTVTGREPR